MLTGIKKIYDRCKNIIFSVLSFCVPFTIYVLTLETKLIGGDTSWYALQIPEMSLMVPTGYPTFSMSLKLFTFLPIGDLAYRLNLYSAFFGGLTILFLYLAINRLVKNEVISFSSSLIFAFLYPYWYVANRLEFDTLNSFFIALVIFSSVTYSQVKNRRLLYFFFFCLGLSLTNHPIAFFVVPAIFLYVLMVDIRVFKSIRTILVSIAWFILPLFSYLYLIIRSRQGYGPVTDLVKLFYYVTGRNVTGELHGGHFFDKPWSHMLGVMGEYLWIIYDVFGWALIAIALIGLGSLIKKNWKLGLCSILFIAFNVIVPPLYLPYTNDNYVIFSMILVAVFIGLGFRFVLDGSLWLFKKAAGKSIMVRADRALKYILIAAVLLTAVVFASFRPVLYFEQQDRSEPQPVYRFWEQAFQLMEEDSALYIHSFAENVGTFVGRYEFGHKNIKMRNSRNPGYSLEDAKQDFEAGKIVYFVGNANQFALNSDFEKVGRVYYFARNNELLQLYRITSMLETPEITYEIEPGSKAFGEQFMVGFTIENVNQTRLQVTSIELEISENIEFVGVDPQGYISQGPGMSRGMYMWVSDEYYIEPESSIDLLIYLKGTAPGEGDIEFRITTHDVYIEADTIEIVIE